MSVLKLLQKHTILQKENDIWERLEALLNNSTQVIKKEILKLLEIDNTKILSYLLEMYDDDAVEIRNFVYEKLSEIKNFDLIDPATKVKLLYVGLSDNSPKVQTSTKKFLKHYLYSLGVYKGKKQTVDDDKMLVDQDNNNNTEVEHNLKKKFEKKLNLDNPEDESDDEPEGTAHDKIQKITSPMKLLQNKKKLTDSPSRVFDKLDIMTFYNHPKFSYTFSLITESIIEFTDNNDLLGFLLNIVENMKSVSSSQPEMKFLSSEKKRKNVNNIEFSSANSTDGKIDQYALFNDIYFLQNCLRHLSNKQDESTIQLKNSIFEFLPDNRTYAKIMNHFYSKEKNIMILHQLFLIGFHLSYSEEIGNQEMIKFMRKFISDLELETFTIQDYSFRRLDFTSNVHSQPDEIAEYNNEELSPENMLQKNLENILLPPTRKMILSLEDLVEHALKILLKIHYNEHSQLFTSIMEVVDEISEPLQVGENQSGLSELKFKQKEIVEQIKEKLAIIGNLENSLKNSGKSRIEIEKKIKRERDTLELLDDKLFSLTKDEKNILMRKLKLCEFLIKYCKLPVSMFENMTHSIILPTLTRKDIPEVLKLSYNAMGLLAINFFNSNYRNFLRLFYEQVEKNNPDFTEFEMLSLLIIFDSILQHNIQETEIIQGNIEDKIELIIKKYLYHSDPVPRVIAFTGICKLLIANRIGRPEYVLSRLIAVLYKSFQTVERHNEDFHVKIFEIMQNFLYAYCLNNKTHIKTVVKSILIIITSQSMGENTSSSVYDKTVARDFQEVRPDFFNQFLLLIHDFAAGQSSLRKFVFKIFKYLFFIYKYTSGDFDKALENENEEDVLNNSRKSYVTYRNKKTIKDYIKKIFDKCRYDKYLLNEMADDNLYIKLFPFMLCLDDHHAIRSFSDSLGIHFEQLKEKNFIYDYSGSKMDLGVEEKQNEMRDYVYNKQVKYYKLIEENCAFVSRLKGNKLNVIEEENSKIMDEEELNEENKHNKSSLTTGATGNNISRRSTGNKRGLRENNTSMSDNNISNIKEEIENEEDVNTSRRGNMTRNTRNVKNKDYMIDIEEEEEKNVRKEKEEDYMEEDEIESEEENNKAKKKGRGNKGRKEDENDEEDETEKKGIKRRSSVSPGDKKKANKKKK
jgi:hypothetical protein